MKENLQTGAQGGQDPYPGYRGEGQSVNTARMSLLTNEITDYLQKTLSWILPDMKNEAIRSG